MSLHANLTPEATTRLKQQQRTSILLSVIIALLTLGLIILTLLLILLPALKFESDPIVSLKGDLPPETLPSRPELNPNIHRKPTSPTAQSTRILAVSIPAPVSVPVPEHVDQVDTRIGSGDDFGEVTFPGREFGSGPGPIPLVYRKRCSPEDRLHRLKASGGTPACEEAVMKALRWLQRNQHADGSWGDQAKIAYTGLVLLAYLGHCETPVSEEFGDAVTKAIVFLIDNCQKQKGRMASNLEDRHWCYSHAIAAYALAESYTFCSQLGVTIPQLRDSVQQSIQWIINNQNKSGGWDYNYEEGGQRGGDLSITAWQLQALKAAMITRLDFKNLRNCIRRGLAYCETCQASSGGFGYTSAAAAGGGKHLTLSGAGALCFQQHKGASHAAARKGMRYVVKESSFDYEKGPANLYEHYYSSQAAMNHGGKTWETYNALFRDQLLKHQNDDGSWPDPPGNPPGNHKSPVYNTALATLMLEVYYRFLPTSNGQGTDP